MFEDLEKNLTQINKTNRFYRDQQCKRVLKNGVRLFFVNIGRFILRLIFIGIIGGYLIGKIVCLIIYLIRNI